MLIEGWTDVPISLSLSVVVGILATTIILSMLTRTRDRTG
jgi:ABC-type enterochelin transport system permease subunit